MLEIQADHVSKAIDKPLTGRTIEHGEYKSYGSGEGVIRAAIEGGSKATWAAISDHTSSLPSQRLPEGHPQGHPQVVASSWGIILWPNSPW